MTVESKYLHDVDEILSHRYDQGGELWTTPDKRILKGSPFSTLGSAQLLIELGMSQADDVLKDIAALIFSTWQEDGRFRVYPTGGIYPCQTGHALNVLCQLGYAGDPRIKKTFEHLLSIQEPDGGWRCHKFSFGRGPETAFSNPFPTLIILNAFRYRDDYLNESVLNQAVAFLLNHWTTKSPLGPCHYGIGTLFMQVEYPFSNYNLFIYVYVLSFYQKAVEDSRFLEALSILESKMVDGKIVVERISPKLSKLS